MINDNKEMERHACRSIIFDIIEFRPFSEKENLDEF